MHLVRAAAFGAALLLGAAALDVAPARAADSDPCAAGMICASNPQSVIDAMKKAGYTVEVGTDNTGDPMIDSSSTFGFTVYFYGCEEHKNCDSLRFEVLFKKAPENTEALANKWNAGKRFLQMSVKPAGTLAVAYDVATIGGLNQRNFADVLDWWSSMLEELGKFFQAEVPDAVRRDQEPPADAPKK